jgi:tetratricopeptide (TPR) repeat protein
VIAPNRRLAVAAAGLAAACVALYAATLGHGFVWDDEHYVVPVVQDRSAAGLARALGSDLVQAGDPSSDPSGYWRPLASLTLWADGALPGGAAPFHATNVLLHAACAALLLLLLVRRLGPEAGLAVPVVAALAWAFHPQHVEPVAWISGRYELLTALFALLLLLVRREARAASVALLAAAFAAGLLSKESFAVIALVAVADDWASGRRVREALPAWLALGAVALAVVAARRALGVGTPPVPWTDAPWNVLSAVAIYLGRAIVPLPLGIGHPYAGPAPWVAVAGGAVLAALLAMALRWRRLATPVALFVAPLVPLGLAMGGIGEAPERYFYLPSLGLAWLLAEDLVAVRRSWPAAGRACVAAAGVACVAGTIASALRLPDWRDDRALYGAELRRHPDDWRANLFLGNEAIEDGRLDEALALLTRAEAGVGSGQAAWDVQAVLSRAHFLRGDADAAIAHASAALRLAPRRPMPYLLLAAAYHAKGNHTQELMVADAGLQRWPDLETLRLPHASAMCEIAPGEVCERELERIARLGQGDAADAWAEAAAQAVARRDLVAARARLEELRRLEPGHPRLRALEQSTR